MLTTCAQHHVMLPNISLRKLNLPNISYGPFRMMEAVPWLMLATMFRFLDVSRPPIVSVAFRVVEALAIFLAFLLASRRMIEATGGYTRLGDLDFAQQLRLGWKIIRHVFLLLFVAALLCSLLIDPWVGLHLLLGFDGVAFDQFTHIGRLWSSVLGIVVFLMVLQAANRQEIKLLVALRELGARCRWLVPAVLVAFAAHVALFYIQGEVRSAMFAFALPGRPSNLLYFFFVFGFATVRLWITLAIFSFFSRESYRRQRDLSPKAANPS